MIQLPTGKAVVCALWVNAALLLGIILQTMGRERFPSMLPLAFGQDPTQLSPQPIAGGGGMFLMPAQFSQNTWGCYIMDIDTQVLCAYQYMPGDKQLRLVAAREFRYDRRLKEFNTPSPTPAEVKRMIEKQEDPGRTGATKPTDESAEKPNE